MIIAIFVYCFGIINLLKFHLRSTWGKHYSNIFGMHELYSKVVGDVLGSESENKIRIDVIYFFFINLNVVFH